ncbi:MAG: PRD domain-containing protein [Lachnospiraceae bacterium]|nr:PRD domain-containing protein [Lachnospiraceae bacterium]
MKSNKDKIYDIICLSTNYETGEGVSTTYIAEALNLQRTNVSSGLNQLVKEGKVSKSNGRPVKYYAVKELTRSDCFAKLIGAKGSLRQAVQLAKAAVLYPNRCLNTILVGAKGTGKSYFAGKMYRLAVERGIKQEDAAFVQINCQDYAQDLEGSLSVLKEQFAKTCGGVLYLDNIQYLPSVAKRYVLDKAVEDTGCMLIISCTENSQLQEEDFLVAFPMRIELPLLSQRPLTERLDLVKKHFHREAARIKRKLVVKGDLMRALLSYECEANYHQLKGDIKIGCANAFVREYKSQEDIQLFLSDFPQHVRKGLLRSRQFKKELEELVPVGSSFIFSEDEMNVSKAAGLNFYERISQKAEQLQGLGLEQEEVDSILSTEVERTFAKYKVNLVGEVADKSQLAVLVDEILMDLVEEFLKNAEQTLDRKFPSSVFYGLCLHIKGVIEHTQEQHLLDKSRIAEILSKHQKEYLLASELAGEVGKIYSTQLSAQEIALLTMFLCYPQEESGNTSKPVILFAFYGEGIATAIAKTVTSMVKLDNIYAFELAYERNSKEVYTALKNYIADIHQGKGVLVVYDSSFLPEMLSEIEAELGVFIRQFPAPITTMGIELARRTATESNPEVIYKQAIGRLGELMDYGKNYIVTLCTTGMGGAKELKRYIEQYGKLSNTEVIPMAIEDREALQESFGKLMRQGYISCVVGTFDPQLFSIPFISISEVFGTKKENLPKLLSLEKEAKLKIDYESMFEYLNEQLEYTNINKLRKVLPAVLKRINEEIVELSLDAEAGLLVHLACLVDRMIGKQKGATNPRKSMILSKYEVEFRKLLRIVKELEKAFRIIVTDDEIANILTIIYQL